jgi:hypothetical protein
VIAAASTVAWWVPLVTAAALLVGVVLGWVGDFWRDRRQSDRELAKWRAEFQRTNLLELQDAVTRISEKGQLVVNQKQRTYDQQGVWPDRVDANPDEWSARFEALKLAERLDDDHLRECVKNFTHIAAQAIREQDPQEASVCAFVLVGTYAELNEMIGVALRNVLGQART